MRGCRFGEIEGQRRQHPLAVENGVTKDRAGMRSTDLMKAGMPFRAGHPGSPILVETSNGRSISNSAGSAL